MLLTHFRGPEFRKAFKRIGGLRALTKVPFMCLTASAPPAIEAEILESVGLHDPVVIRQPINRPNIFYVILKKSGLSVSYFDITYHSFDWFNYQLFFAERSQWASFTTSIRPKEFSKNTFILQNKKRCCKSVLFFT